MKKESKVLFSLKNFHYALHQVGPDGTITFAKPVPVPGMVSMLLSQTGDMVKFYADGCVFYQASNNAGYEGDMEIARIPDQMQSDVWGMKSTETDEVQMENANDTQTGFAALFEINGDESGELYCFYNCSASRPNIEMKTSEENKTPQPQKLSLSAVPLPNGDIKARTTAKTPDEVRKNWFEQVYQKAGAAPAQADGVQ